MQVTFIPSEEVNSELGIVNAARVSLGKKSSSLTEADKKLIRYLLENKHWTPFAHARVYFEIRWRGVYDEVFFLRNYHPGGFAKISAGGRTLWKGSVYSWLNNIQFLDYDIHDAILAAMCERYPTVTENFPLPTEGVMTRRVVELWEPEIVAKKLWNLATVTLLVKVPIFIARQIRTSQVGFAYGDLYVEGESFVFNEVSRRYVKDTPQFYEIENWRVREGSRVKQGSTGIASDIDQFNMDERMCRAYEAAYSDYTYAEKHAIAPEQARALLPQSMYTEFYMTGTLERWTQFIELRSGEHVQEETREVVALICKELAIQFPTWPIFSSGS